MSRRGLDGGDLNNSRRKDLAVAKFSSMRSLGSKSDTDEEPKRRSVLVVRDDTEGCSLAGKTLLEELKPIQQRMKEYMSDLSGVDAIISEGCEAARDVAQDTMEEVRKVMGLSGR